MSRLTVKCPKCEYKESIISTSTNALMPPCPRCEGGGAFIRMADITPVGGQQTVISTAGSQSAEQPTAEALPKPVVTPKRRDPRDFGPEPRA